jgi:hypothetical protein
MKDPLTSGSMQDSIFLIEEVIAPYIHRPVDEFHQTN